MKEKTLGQVAYEVHGWGGGTKSIDEQEPPGWEHLDQKGRARWEMVARAVRESDAEPDHALLDRG